MINDNKRRPKMKIFIVYYKSTNDGGALVMMCKVDFGSKLKVPIECQGCKFNSQIKPSTVKRKSLPILLLTREGPT